LLIVEKLIGLSTDKSINKKSKQKRPTQRLGVMGI